MGGMLLGIKIAAHVLKKGIIRLEVEKMCLCGIINF